MKLKTLLQENVQLNKVNSLDQLKGITDVVDVTGDVNLYNKKLTTIPAKFGKVGGNFDCYVNNLTSLEGCPSEVGGRFNCSNNKLTSLEGCPAEVGGSFTCGDNDLISLEGCPSEVGGNFSCSNNHLTSLEGCPSEVGGNFSCNYNKLTSLVDIHKLIKKMNGTFYIYGNPIKEGGLSLLLIDGLKEIKSNNPALKIIGKYAGQGKAVILDCQEELIEAGYGEFTKL